MSSEESTGSEKEAAEELAEKVPPKKEARVKKETTPVKDFETGVEGLDDALGGGLPNRSLLLLIGAPGSHYTTFAQQILYNHVLRGEKVAYYIVENPSFDVMEDMAVYKWELDKYLQNKSWIFINLLTPDMQELAELSPSPTSEAQVILSQSLATLKKDFLSRAKDGRWTALHASHLLLRYDFRDFLDAVLYMRLVTRHYAGVHFILVPTEVHEDQKINSLKHLADGVFEFSMQERGREYEGIFTVTKLRRTIHKTKTYSFLLSDKGMYIERAERIT